MITDKEGGVTRCKRLMLKLMNHRVVDVSNFVEGVRAELEISDDWNEANRILTRYFRDLRDDLEDIDCAIIEVLLAENLAEAESIVSAFHVNKA